MTSKYSAAFLKEISSFKPHKGGKGAVCVIGGSFEYSGAPYYSAISALRTGVDLSFIICDKEASPIIKSYSPELIVFGLLDGQRETKIELPPQILNRTTCFVIGPGLSRNEHIFEQVITITTDSRIRNVPLIFDGDGIELFCKYHDSITSNHVILTPNANELHRLEQKFDLNTLSQNIWIYCKNIEDKLLKSGTTVMCDTPGAPRRCGGLGDVLSGVISACISMSGDINHIDEIRIKDSILFSGELLRKTSRNAFLQRSRAMSATDVINNLHLFFDDIIQKSASKVE